MCRFILITLLLIFPINLFAETASLTREEQKALYLAQQAIEGKNYQKARKLILEHLETNPDKPNPLLFHTLGQAWYLDGNPSKAFKIYEKGLKLYPSSFLLCSNLATTAYDLGENFKAGDLFKKAYHLSHPSDPDLLYQAGTAYYQAKAFEKAKTVIRELIQSGSKPQPPWLRLFIHLSLELESWKEAERVLRQFLNQNPRDVEYWRLLYQVRIRLNDYQGAASVLETIYKISPPAPKDWEELANLYFYMNIPLQAARCLEHAYGSKPAPKICEKLSDAYIQAQRTDKAIYYLDMAIQQERNSKYFLEKGKLYYEHGNWDASVKSLRECIRMDPANELAHLLLGYCAMEKEDVGLARKYLLKASVGTRYKAEALSALDILKDFEELGMEN